MSVTFAFNNSQLTFSRDETKSLL